MLGAESPTSERFAQGDDAENFGVLVEPYKDRDENSGVVAFEAGADFIRVQFESGSVYLYTNESAGPAAIAWMRVLATSGDGLSAFIARHVRSKYASRER